MNIVEKYLEIAERRHVYGVPKKDHEKVLDLARTLTGKAARKSPPTMLFYQWRNCRTMLADDVHAVLVVIVLVDKYPEFDSKEIEELASLMVQPKYSDKMGMIIKEIMGDKS